MVPIPSRPARGAGEGVACFDLGHLFDREGETVAWRLMRRSAIPDAGAFHVERIRAVRFVTEYYCRAVWAGPALSSGDSRLNWPCSLRSTGQASNL